MKRGLRLDVRGTETPRRNFFFCAGRTRHLLEGEAEMVMTNHDQVRV